MGILFTPFRPFVENPE